MPSITHRHWNGRLTPTPLPTPLTLLLLLFGILVLLLPLVDCAVFVGLRGQTGDQIHGLDGEYYNILSTTTMQLNARFTLLEEGECPPKEPYDCWSQADTYMGSIGLQLRVPFAPSAGDVMPPKPENLIGRRLNGALVSHLMTHPDDLNSTIYTLVQRLLIESGPASDGFKRVELNRIDLKSGDLMTMPFPMTPELEVLHDLGAARNREPEHQHSYIHYISPWKLIVHTPSLQFTFSNSDHFVRVGVRFSCDESRTLYEQGRSPMHGLLGQTISGRDWPAQTLRYVEGGDADAYVVQVADTESEDQIHSYNVSERLFGTEFAYNRFTSDAILDVMERTGASLASLQSGQDMSVSWQNREEEWSGENELDATQAEEDYEYAQQFTHNGQSPDRVDLATYDRNGRSLQSLRPHSVNSPSGRSPPPGFTDMLVVSDSSDGGVTVQYGVGAESSVSTWRQQAGMVQVDLDNMNSNMPSFGRRR